MYRIVACSIFSVLLWACEKQQTEDPLFRTLPAEETGITFSNNLTPTRDLNIFAYLYFYNGGGVGAADLNNDGLSDLIFTSNTGENKIYLNKGELKFEDITSRTGFDTQGGWSNGVSVADVNQDGLLDIYISQVGDYKSLQGVNQLFICQKLENGIPIYEEQAEKYGLNLKVFGTQALFVDFDTDGDLDFFQLNHSVHQNGTFGKRENFLNQYHPLSGDRYFENRDGIYLDKTKESGIFSNALGYGLGITAGDINLDGRPDIYVGNDFHENDYLYINEGNGRFAEQIDLYMTHTSRFSMGIDIGDINNDIFPDIISLDMLPWDYKLIKMADGEDVFYNFNFKLRQGYNIQFSRNTLQLNNGNGTFSEIGMMAGVHATDWSWSSIFSDFDNDGKKDLFISNGINKRMNDTDYMNYVSNDAIQEKINRKEIDESSELLTDLLPEVKIPNKFFRNRNGIQFDEVTTLVSGNEPSFSNGAVSVDLDNDGDLDLVTNNINAPAFIYENLTTGKTSLQIKLKGSEKNKNGIGTKVILFTKQGKQYQEKFPVRGFQSSVEAPLVFGLDTLKSVDSLWVIWPDNTYETITNVAVTPQPKTLEYKQGLPRFDYSRLEVFSETPYTFTDIAREVDLEVSHSENTFNEFDREALIPAMHSTKGPVISVADVNQDGLEDFFMGSSKWEKARIFLQTPSGKFVQSTQPALDADSTYEESSAVFADLNGDGYPDLALASGGNEYYGKNNYLKPRIFLNDGKGMFLKKQGSLPDIFDTQSVITSSDVDGDGDLDLFLGGETIPWAFGKIPRSYLLLNNGNAEFRDATPKELAGLGMVTDAHWIDLDQDKDEDLILSIEWGGIEAFINEKGTLKRKTISPKKGWWKRIIPMDVNNDGLTDFILGNLGENSRIKATEKEPVRMYVNDMDDNGRLDQILTHYMAGQEVVFADKKEFERQMPFIRKKYNLSKDFANADFRDIFGKEKMEASQIFEADFLKNAILINKGKGKYELLALPESAQISPLLAAVLVGTNELLTGGNFYECNIQMGRYDADYGSLMRYTNGALSRENIPGMVLNGQIRTMRAIKIGKDTCYLVGRNNDKLMVLKKTSK